MLVVEEHTDAELLERLARDRSRDAFEQIVRRHIDLVYSAAQRRVRDPHLAEDVTQAVFLMFWQRPQSLRRRTHLIGWLYQSTKYAAANALRMQRRRKAHEAAAGALPRSEQRMDSLWKDVEPVLDNALDSLSRSDRQVILLRYFRGLSVKELSGLLNVNENAAAKRVSRAIERLRVALVRRGVGTETPALATILVRRAVEQAPASVIHAATSTGAAAASAAATAIAKGAFVMIAAQKATLIAALVVIALLVPATVGVIARRAGGRGPEPTPPPAQQQANGPQAAANTLFDRVLPEIKFDSVPLADVVDFLRDVSGANIYVDWAALAQVGVRRNSPVTQRLTNVPFFTALVKILQDLSRDAAVRISDENVIEISTVAGVRELGHREEWSREVIRASPGLAKKLPEIRLDAVAFSDAMDFMKEVSGWNEVLYATPDARKSLKDVITDDGIDLRTPITLRLRDVSIVQGLDLILAQVKVPAGKALMVFSVRNAQITIAIGNASPPSSQPATAPAARQP
jgi:RNA polymerase sigma factor (sigma-70 family)